MPLEIKELHIRISVNQQQGQGSAPASGNPDGGGEEDKGALSEQLLEELLEVIKNKDER